MIFATLRSKIIANSSLIILIIASTTFYTSLASSELARSMGILFFNNMFTRNTVELLTKSHDNLTTYLSIKSSESLNDYLKHSALLKLEANKLNREIRDDEVLLLQRNLAGLIDAWLEKANQAIDAKRGRDIEAYSSLYQDSEYLLDLIKRLRGIIDNLYLADTLKAYQGFSANLTQVMAYNVILVLVATVTGILLLIQYSFSITSPMVQLARAARALGRGDYSYELPVPASQDEIGTTIAAFSSMQKSVVEAIDSLRSKAEIERTLLEERMRAIDMDRKLKDAELLALQTQINPHFLFNTLFAGMQLAQKEEARRTESFLENLAGFIRYALKSPLRQVTLAEEFESIRQYIWLLQLRFRERFIFVVEVESESLLDAESPALILQPLVENAVTHGLKDREEGGVVTISAQQRGDKLHLCVSDNGEGMSPAEVDHVFREALVDERLHDGGIGLRNVVRRVYLNTGDLGRIRISSVKGEGTSITFILDLHMTKGAQAT